jgi:lysophospholipase L1-like esterase
MQNRLVAFGCSLTYGHGLPDCLEKDNTPGLYPSKYAWPQLLADRLNKECVNEALSGSSNKRVWHRIVNFDYKDSDTVIILWTSPDRYGIVKSQKEIFDIGPWMADNNKIANAYYSKIHNEYNSKLETALYIHHSDLFLKKQGINPIHLILSKNQSDCFCVKNLEIDFISLFITDAKYMDDVEEPKLTGHPGTLGHELFFKDLYNFLNTR